MRGVVGVERKATRASGRRGVRDEMHPPPARTNSVPPPAPAAPGPRLCKMVALENRTISISIDISIVPQLATGSGEVELLPL